MEPSDTSASKDPLRHCLCATTAGNGGPVVVGNGEQVAPVALVMVGAGPIDLKLPYERPAAQAA